MPRLARCDPASCPNFESFVVRRLFPPRGRGGESHFSSPARRCRMTSYRFARSSVATGCEFRGSVRHIGIEYPTKAPEIQRLYPIVPRAMRRRCRTKILPADVGRRRSSSVYMTCKRTGIDGSWLAASSQKFKTSPQTSSSRENCRRAPSVVRPRRRRGACGPRFFRNAGADDARKRDTLRRAGGWEREESRGHADIIIYSIPKSASFNEATVVVLGR